MKNNLFLIGIFYLLAISCSNNVGNNTSEETIAINKFSDTILQQIMEYQYNRNTEELLKFTNHKLVKYRMQAAKAFASVQDTLAITKLADLLKDKDSGVRIAAAFALGQTGHVSGAELLYLQFLSEKNNLVKKQMLEAIGKCGNEKNLQQVLDLDIKYEDDDVLAGKALALARFSIRKIFNNHALSELISLISSKKVSGSVKYNASIALNRVEFELSDTQLDTLITAFQIEQSINTKLNFVAAVGKNKSEKSRMFLIKLLNNSGDYRLRINALRSLSKFDYNLVSDAYFQSLSDSSVNVAIAASEYFLQNGEKSDARKYFNYSSKTANWRVSANLLTAAVKYSDDKKKFSEQIITKFNKSKNNYEKAWLLKALGGDLSKLKFVRKEVFSTKIPIIRSMGIESISAMRAHNEFKKYSKKYKFAEKKALNEVFADIFKQAVLSGDVALISIASAAIRNPEFKLKNDYENTNFLTEALHNCKLPKQIEAYLDLQKTIDYLNGTETTQMPEFEYKKLNWELITSIKPNQKIEVLSSVGNFIIQLNVEDNPATVSAFIELINSGFYKNKHIHRVVPNFVIQDGCPRGDGWGSPDFSIRSEYYHSYYQEGSLGMASAGKDTESSQWFVTHSPTPHLDGRYTLFGKVIEGIEVVHKIQVGDEILNIQLIE